LSMAGHALLLKQLGVRVNAI